MTDRLSPEHRSWNMSRIRGKNTKPEIVVRSLLHRMGYRFSLRNTGLPGKPDIVLPEYKTVVFVHGCYWHRHKGCKKATTPHNNAAFWSGKFDGNIRRDRKNQIALREKGWNPIVVWECQVRRDPLRVRPVPGVRATGRLYGWRPCPCFTPRTGRKLRIYLEKAPGPPMAHTSAWRRAGCSA